MNSIRQIQFRKETLGSVLLRKATTQSFSPAHVAGNFYDVAIVGGGAVGSSLAHLLNRKLPSLRVALIEATEPPPRQPPPHGIPNPRSYALSPQSLNVIGEAVTSRLPLGYYDSMQVWEADSPASLTFTSSDLHGDHEKSLFLGACCEDQHLVTTLWDEIQGSTDCMTHTRLQSISTGDTNTLAKVTTVDGEEFHAALLIGADGGQSWVRKSTGIARVGGEYEHSALTFTVALAKDSLGMTGRAYQRYLSDGGPIALLPTHSPEHAVVVWSSSPETLAKWNSRHDDDLALFLNECLEEGPMRVPPLLERKSPQASGSVLSNLFYGAEKALDTLHYGLAMASQQPNPSFRVPPRISAIASPKFCFPLSCFQSSTYVKGRVVLVGDAAHTVHPMAGQGLNLGLGDVDFLVTCIVKAHRSGMDLSSFLNEYNTDRHRSVSVSLGGIHILQQLFLLRSAPMQHMKTLGLNLVQNVRPLRRKLAMAAAHGVAL